LLHDAVTTDVRFIDVNQGDSAAILSGYFRSTRAASNDDDAWLAQAMRLRAEAFRLGQSLFLRNLASAIQVKSRGIPGPAKSRVDCAASPTAGYLIESEKMFELMKAQRSDPVQGRRVR
jgi:hypothetical protein